MPPWCLENLAQWITLVKSPMVNPSSEFPPIFEVPNNTFLTGVPMSFLHNLDVLIFGLQVNATRAGLNLVNTSPLPERQDIKKFWECNQDRWENSVKTQHEKHNMKTQHEKLKDCNQNLSEIYVTNFIFAFLLWFSLFCFLSFSFVIVRNLTNKFLFLLL